MSTIVAISTPYGTGGIAVIRLTGPEALAIADRAWKGRPLAQADTHTARLGTIVAADGSALDQAVATVFRAPRSFTGEDTVEFSVHGSKWIQRQVVERLVQLGAAPASPGEFTRRAFLNGRMDLAQAEAVADLIASSSRAAHRLALNQMSGGFSRQLESLRQNLVELASLLELELDFSEEDVEFADRTQLLDITDRTLALIERLASTYSAGRAFKEGVPVAIAGRPNAGKSTLLNRLLGEDKAIVSDIPGTTRDIIEDTREIDGILFRFHDTAGLRDTDDTVERIGIDRARDAIDRAAIVLWLLPPAEDAAFPADTRTADTSSPDMHTAGKGSVNGGTVEELARQLAARPDARHIILFTKSDLSPADNSSRETAVREELTRHLPATVNFRTLRISAKSGEGIERLERALSAAAKTDHDPDAELIVTNARHHAELLSGAAALRRVRAALRPARPDCIIPPDMMAQDVREALHHLGLLTGAVTTDTLLATIFSRFCVGK